MVSSDVVYVSLNDRQKPAVVPTEARGGHEFFGALCDRGYLPESVWRRASLVFLPGRVAVRHDRFGGWLAAALEDLCLYFLAHFSR